MEGTLSSISRVAMKPLSLGIGFIESTKIEISTMVRKRSFIVQPPKDLLYNELAPVNHRKFVPHVVTFPVIGCEVTNHFKITHHT